MSVTQKVKTKPVSSPENEVGILIDNRYQAQSPHEQSHSFQWILDYIHLPLPFERVWLLSLIRCVLAWSRRREQARGFFNFGSDLVPLCFKFMVSFSYFMDTFDVFNNLRHVEYVVCDGWVSAQHHEKAARFRENEAFVSEIDQQLNQGIYRIRLLINSAIHGRKLENQKRKALVCELPDARRYISLENCVLTVAYGTLPNLDGFGWHFSENGCICGCSRGLKDAKKCPSNFKNFSKTSITTSTFFAPCQGFLLTCNPSKDISPHLCNVIEYWQWILDDFQVW